MKEFEIRKRIPIANPISPELAKKVKEKMGWDYPVDNGKVEEEALDASMTPEDEEQDQMYQVRISQRTNSDFPPSPLPKELAAKLKTLFGWDYPIEDSGK